MSPQDEVSSKGVLSIHVVSLGRLQAGKAGTGSSPCRILGGSYNVSVCVCVVSVIVKRPVLPPCVVDGRSRNPFYNNNNNNNNNNNIDNLYIVLFSDVH